MNLRPYQQQALDSVYRQWNGGARSTMLVLATGLGKSVCATHITAHGAEHGRTLFLAHREELLQQISNHYERVGLTTALERAESRVDVGTWPDVVIGSVATLRSDKRMGRYPRNYFARIIIDEAHHAVAKSYRDIVEYFCSAKILGLSATPDRTDGIGLGSDELFEDVAMRYDLGDAVHDGWLVPLIGKTHVVQDIDLSQVKMLAGDLNAAQLEAQVNQEAALHKIADPLVRESEGRPSVIYMPGVGSAHELVRILSGYVGADSCAAIDGTTPRERRAEILDSYARGNIRFLANCMVLSEGWDAPNTSCVAMARPTKSRSLKAQMIGRGTRALPGVIDGLETRDERKAAIEASAKPNLLILDFTGVGRVELAGPADVLGGEPIPPDAQLWIAEELAKDVDPRPIEEILEAALEYADKVEAERTEAKKRARVKVVTEYVTSPMELVGLGDARIDVIEEVRKAVRATRTRDCKRCHGAGTRPSDGKPCQVCKGKGKVKGVSWNEGGPTQASVAFLDRHGIKLPATALNRQAAAAIEVIRARDLCSLPQARTLAQHGLRTDLPKAEAGEAISALAANGWRASSEIQRRWGRHGTVSVDRARARPPAASGTRSPATERPTPSARRTPEVMHASPPSSPVAAGRGQPGRDLLPLWPRANGHPPK